MIGMLFITSYELALINFCDIFRCEFPLTLNMEAYTKEYLARQEMETANLRMSAVSLK